MHISKCLPFALCFLSLLFVPPAKGGGMEIYMNNIPFILKLSSEQQLFIEQALQGKNILVDLV